MGVRGRFDGWKIEDWDGLGLLRELLREKVTNSYVLIEGVCILERALHLRQVVYDH